MEGNDGGQNETSGQGQVADGNVINRAYTPYRGTAAKESRPERLTLANVEAAFTYQPWNAEQVSAGDEVRSALMKAAQVILARVPESPLRTRALNNLIDARMIANAAITFAGRF